MDKFEMVQPWGLAALAAAARVDMKDAVAIEVFGNRSSGRFAHALGFTDVVNGRVAHGRPEAGRTVKLRRVNNFPDIEPVAHEISKLIVQSSSDDDFFDAEETRRTIYYVMVELLRNVIQHSRDPLGAVIVAQAMEKGVEYDTNASIQVAVADSGIGIFAALSSMHEEINTPAMALERSLWPYFSGAFDKTSRGTSQNAGLGLFFVSEMAKLAGGRLLIATKGATLNLQGKSETGLSDIDTLPSTYDGTLVVFEVPKRGVGDFDAMIAKIIDRAEARSPSSHKLTWIDFGTPPGDAFEFVVKIAGENTVVAESFSQKQVLPRLAQKQPVVLNFANVPICTQSFMHALLFEALRMAWAIRTKIYVANVAPAVRDGIRLLESYALGD